MKSFSFDYCSGDEFLGGICRHPVGTYCFIGTHMGELGVLFIDVSCLFFIKVCLFCCDIHLPWGHPFMFHFLLLLFLLFIDLCLFCFLLHGFLLFVLFYWLILELLCGCTNVICVSWVKGGIK